MNLVDTSGWIEYFFSGPNVSFFTKPVEKTEELITGQIENAVIWTQDVDFEGLPGVKYKETTTKVSGQRPKR